jgi:glutathione S-transferase
MLKLYYAPRACSLAPHIALEEAGADYEGVLVNFAEAEQRSPEYLKLNPKGRVPTLVTDKGVLTENPVILGYIAQTFPEAKLADNDDSFAFGTMQAFNCYLSSTVHVAFAHGSRAERYADDPAAIAAIKAKAPTLVASAFALIEEKLADGRPFVHGDAYTVSDPYLFVMTRWLAREGMPGTPCFPFAEAHMRRLNERPAVRRALEHEGLKPL